MRIGGVNIDSRVGVPIITTAQAKKYLNIASGYADDNDFIDELITDCQGIIEMHNKIVLQDSVVSSRRYGFYNYPCKWVDFGVRTIRAITGVTYTDTDGDQQTFSADNYYLDTTREEARLYYKKDVTFPECKEGTTVDITMTAGYAATDVAQIPRLYTMMMRLLISEFYENRVNLPAEKMSIVERILNNDRIPSI